jgi:hypothetical protein
MRIFLTSSRIHAFEKLLFGYDFDGADGGVVRRGSEIDFEFALSGGFDVGKGFHQRLGTGFPKNIKSL